MEAVSPSPSIFKNEEYLHGISAGDCLICLGLMLLVL